MAGLSINSLRVFDRIVLTGTLSEAAKTLNMSQSAASRQLIELERALNLKLFHRTNRHLIPTDEGLRFHDETQHILAGINEVPAIVQKIKTSNRENLSVVCAPRLSTGLLAPALSRFCEANPNVDAAASVLRHFDIERWAATRNFDIGLGMLPISHRALTTEPLFEVRAAALMLKTNPLATLDELPIERLVEETLIGYVPGLMARQQLDDMFRSAGVAVDYRRQVSSSLLACQLVVEGAGIAIIDVAAMWRMGFVSELALVPLRPARWWSIGLFHLKNSKPSNHADAFKQTIEGLIHEMSGHHRWARQVRPRR